MQLYAGTSRDFDQLTRREIRIVGESCNLPLWMHITQSPALQELQSWHNCAATNGNSLGGRKLG